MSQLIGASWRPAKPSTVSNKISFVEHLTNLIGGLYEKRKVKINNNISYEFYLAARVRQGCDISPLLFNIYGKHVMTEG